MRKLLMFVGVVACLALLGGLAGSQPGPVSAQDPDLLAAQMAEDIVAYYSDQDIDLSGIDLSESLERLFASQGTHSFDKGDFNPTGVRGQTFEVWYTGVPGADPGHDCWRFTSTQLCSADTGGCGPVWHDGTGALDVWIAGYPVAANQSFILLFGWDVNSLSLGDIDTLGAVGVQAFEDGTVWNWGFGGVVHPGCTHPSGGGGYTK